MNFVIINLLVAVAFLQGITGVVGQLDKQLGLASTLELYAGANEEANCTGRTGNVCGLKPDDCRNIFLCMESMTDPMKIPCPDGQYCNDGACTNVMPTECEYGTRKFKCNTEGMYPEPSSCKKFNYCVPVSGTPPLALTESECPDGWGYNSVTASCDKKLINGNCAATDRPVPSCRTPSQNDALTGNPSMYYICLPHDGTTDPVLYPSIFKCEGNKKYVKNTYECK